MSVLRTISKKNILKTSKESKSLGNLNKKVYLCNRVVRSSKAQHISEFAFSLNRYLKIATPSFYSEFQSDIVFLIILCKDIKDLSTKKHFVGCDVSKDTLDFALYERGRDYRTFEHVRVSNNLEGLQAMRKWLRGLKVKLTEAVIAMEHTGSYSVALAEWCFKKGYAFVFLHPLDVRNACGRGRNKTDKVDSQFIADYYIQCGKNWNRQRWNLHSSNRSGNSEMKDGLWLTPAQLSSYNPRR